MKRILMLTVAALGLGLAATTFAAELVSPSYSVPQPDCYYDEGCYRPATPQVTEQRELVPEIREEVRMTDLLAMVLPKYEGQGMPELYNDENGPMPAWH